MAYVITGLITVVTGVILYLLKDALKENKELRKQKEDAELERQTALENGLVCILRKHLMDEHEAWMAKGYITPQALESGIAMYKAYKALGGNGMIDHMEEEIQNLPIKD